MTTANDRLASLVDVAQGASDEMAFSFCLRDFLDAFYAHPAPEKLENAPPLLADLLQDDGRADAYLAAVAEFLARKYRFAVPAWTREASRILHTPFFALDSHAARRWLIVESPVAFRDRNIFVSADALARA